MHASQNNLNILIYPFNPFYYFIGSSSANKKRINGIFDVNANDKLVYIGLIDIDSKIVFDDSDRALVELKYKYHGLNNIHQKRLIIFEKER